MPTPTLLVRVDRYSWYFFASWFFIASLLLLLQVGFARDMAHWGVILILVNTVLRLALLANQFRTTHNRLMFLLCWLLMGILGASVVLQLLLRK